VFGGKAKAISDGCASALDAFISQPDEDKCLWRISLDAVLKNDVCVEQVLFTANYREIKASNEKQHFCLRQSKNKWFKDTSIFEEKQLWLLTFWLFENTMTTYVWRDAAVVEAARQGSRIVIEKLWNMIPEIAHMYDAHTDALVAAITNGHYDIVQFLVSKKVDVRAKEEMAITVAGSEGQLSILEFLLSGSEFKDMKGKCKYALIGAASSNHPSIVKFLISKGVDIHVSNDYVLKWAVKGEHLDILELLMEKAKSTKQPYKIKFLCKQYKSKSTAPTVKDYLKKKLGIRLSRCWFVKGK